ncbi:MAG: hypothetical protein H0V96_04465 [Acidimicrobiia bacterium]|nr:hypothetical protein [Acidimicrobiia bacterium]
MRRISLARTWPSLRSLGPLLVVTMVLGGCGAPPAELQAGTDTVRTPAPEASTSTSSTGHPVDHDVPTLQASCGRVLLDGGLAPVLPDTPLDAEAMAALASAASVDPVEAVFFDQYAWSVAMASPDQVTLFGRGLHDPDSDAPSYGTASFTKDGAGWRPDGWGGCRIEVSAPGFGNAHWVLDPETSPDPTTTELAVLIVEQNCASGQPPIGRDIVPVVTTDAGKVVITVLVEPVQGGADCPSNPWHPITIELPEPLGDRTLFDGGVVPHVARPWPPTASSLDSFGRDP